MHAWYYNLINNTVTGSTKEEVMAKKRALDSHLAKEVATLATHIGKALKAAKNSKEIREIKDEALGGLRATGSRIVTAFERAKESKEAQSIKAQAQKVYDASKMKTGSTVEGVSENFASGLRRISQELESLADRLGKK
jgi:hypothetical protein